MAVKEILLEFMNADCYSVVQEYVESMIYHDHQVHIRKHMSKSWIDEANENDPFFIFQEVMIIYKCHLCQKTVKSHEHWFQECYECHQRFA